MKTKNTFKVGDKVLNRFDEVYRVIGAWNKGTFLKVHMGWATAYINADEVKPYIKAKKIKK